MTKKLTDREKMKRSIVRRENRLKAITTAKRKAEREAPPTPALDLLGREAQVGDTIVVPKKGKITGFAETPYPCKKDGTLHLGKAVKISKKGTITLALIGVDLEWRIMPKTKDFLIIDSKTAGHAAKRVLIAS